MATMTINQSILDNAVEKALYDSVLLLQEKIIEITPRDPKRLPLDPSIRVTGNLKRSIDNEKVSSYSYRIGTRQGEAEYGKYLEFGTPHMRPRSFLRKGIIDNKDLVIRHF